MAKKKSEKPTVCLVGNNAQDVTGSMILVVTPKGTQILLECGSIQGEGSLEEEYKINANAFGQLDLCNINYCFWLHPHIDHLGLTPRAYAFGMNAKTVTTPITAKVGKELLLDSAFICKKNAEYLSEKHNKIIAPLYDENDVNNVLNNLYEYGYGDIYDLDDEISFRFLKNNHVVGAASLELFIMQSNGRKYKLFYSSDLGNVAIPERPYTSIIEYCRKANIAIFESTYGSKANYVSKKDRKDEIKFLEDKIREHCIDKKANVVIPSFSFARSQELMTILYQLFKDDRDFDEVDFIVDSNLTKKIIKTYLEILEGDELDLFSEVLSWDRFKIISDFAKETTQVLKSRKPKVIISSSGFCEAGHIREYIKQYIGGENNAIIFCGYASQESLAGKIKKDAKTIKIDNKTYNKKAQIYELCSFSSHMQKRDLVNYICGINAEKVILVHGSKEAKLQLKEACEEKLREMSKTTNIIVSQKNMTVDF